MNYLQELLPFRDRQAQPPWGYCPVCGRELYGDGGACHRLQLAQAEDPEEIWHLKRRIAELTPMLTQVNELAELTEHYYERGYYRNGKYTL